MVVRWTKWVNMWKMIIARYPMPSSSTFCPRGTDSRTLPAQTQPMCQWGKGHPLCCPLLQILQPSTRAQALGGEHQLVSAATLNLGQLTLCSAGYGIFPAQEKASVQLLVTTQHNHCSDCTSGFACLQLHVKTSYCFCVGLFFIQY